MESDIANDSSISLLVTIVINSLACPFTVILNVLVIMAVIRRPRLRSINNILLACLAFVDALTGFIVQPFFILWGTLQLLGKTNTDVAILRSASLRVVSVCSVLHLTLVTCERLIAIKYTLSYPYIVTTRNIKVAVIAIWIFSIPQVAVGIIFPNIAVKAVLALLDTLFITSPVLFIACTYVILYREVLRHLKMIKSQQLPQEEVQRFAKENKALKTTVLVVGAVVSCFFPIAFLYFLAFVLKLNMKLSAFRAWIGTIVMLNSLVNPLIYCWRQKEIRQFVFRLSPGASVVPVAYN